jgi:hypothetical protein
VKRGASARLEPLEVRPRWLVHVGFLFALAAVIAGMLALRRGELDLDEDLFAAGLLALAFWVFALGCGSLARNARAGYALRLDARGLHVPGLEVVPWRAIRDAHLRTYESRGTSFRQLVVHVDAGYSGASARHYERFVFGPIAGLVGERGTIAIPVHLLAIEPESLLLATRAFIASAEVGAMRRADVVGSGRARLLTRRRLP